MTTARKFVTKTDIEHSKLKETELDLTQEWGGWVLLREMSAGDRDWLEASMLADARDGAKVTVEDNSGNLLAMDDFRSKLAALSLVDPATGKKMFSKTQIKSGEAIEFISVRNHLAVAKIATAAVNLNGMSDEEIERLGEGLGKAPDGFSYSDLQENSDVPTPSSVNESEVQK